MMLLSKIIVVVILALLTKAVTSYANDNNGSGSEDFCCITGDRAFYSLNDALGNVTNNAIINLIASAQLYSHVPFNSLENITIIGKRNLIVNCNGIGAFRFISCHNVTIEGISWEKCGSNNGTTTYPAIEFHSSSNILLKNCSFNQSRGQAIKLSNVSGDMNIKNCQFMNNSDYGGHGAGIHYTSDSDYQSQQLLIIDSCVFSFNGAAKSIVYCESSIKNSSDDICLQNSSFANNDGVSIYILHNTLILKGKVLFEDNMATDGGGIFSSSSLVIFDDQSDVTFSNSSAKDNGGAINLLGTRLYFKENSYAKFINNSVGSKGGAVYFTSNSDVQFGENSTITFQENIAGTYGGALCCEDHSSLSFDGDSTIEFGGDNATEGGAVYLSNYCNVSFSGNTTVAFDENKADYGGAVCINKNCNALISGKSTLIFNDNHASSNGGGFYCVRNCNVLFDGNTKVMFYGNTAASLGGALCSKISSITSFSGNSSITFDSNKANIGGAIYCEALSDLSCSGNSSLTFCHSNATYGGAIYFEAFSELLCSGNSSLTFFNSTAIFGGAIYFESFSNLFFDDNSIVIFHENSALFGGAVSCEINSNFSAIGNSTVIFTYNNGTDGGAVHTAINVIMLFDGSSTVSFTNNIGNDEGGAIASNINCSIYFKGNSMVIFKGNRAVSGGGAIFTKLHTHTIFSGNSNITFSNNTAQYGGALKSIGYSDASFHGNSTVIFTNNTATYGGALYSEINSEISFYGNAVVVFMHNVVSVGGGAVAALVSCKVSFDGSSMITFDNNDARYGGAMYSEVDSDFTFVGDTAVMFIGNKGSENGGAIAAYVNSSVSCYGVSSVTFSGNSADSGGAVHIDNCDTLFGGNCNLKFSNNNATCGGAMYSSSVSNITVRNNSIISFNNNTATEDGGVIYALHSHIKFENNSVTTFYHNKAAQNGGALCLTSHFTLEFNSNSTFLNNIAGYHGGAIYGEITENIKSNIFSNTCCIDFLSNSTSMGNDTYIHIDSSCDETCLNTRIVGLQVTHNYPPLRLVLSDPAICINDKNATKYCSNYFVNNTMLGQAIKIKAYVQSIFNKSAGRTDFVLNESNPNLNYIDGSKFVSINSTFEGISIIGKRISEVTEFLISITSNEAGNPNISINLTVGLSPCHLGFQHDDGARRCTCYNSSDIVSCSGSTSTIKRGYWFGIVDGKRTVAVCPNNYCNFTCCEKTNGFYQLSPVRINQCNSHRSGTACGSCEKGYTLSFDSIQCVSVNKCTTGQTVLVVTLSVIYWITLVVVVFAMMYYKVEIGYLYAITYYFSVVDILLGQLLYLSQGLFTIVSIFSSIAKVTPQFLGQFCLVKNMTGVDQQFIHYVHPLAVTIIVGMICLLARISYKFSSFVSREIIRVISFLLLLSYTSVATTSLLLLRSLTFDNVDKVYTYLSPDLEYFHGRHLPYVIIAILSTLVIVISLPLLLLLEPFLNGRINFTRMKPLLDQFQGCYKDKYRCFAAYYMACRLVIILIVVINPPDTNVTQILLVAASTVLGLIQLTLRPYASETLNNFDGVILHIMILVSMTPLVESLDQDLSISIAFTLVILPLINFSVMQLLINKEGIKKLIKYCRHNKPTVESNTSNNDIPTNDFAGIIIDDSRRINATICEV